MKLKRKLFSSMAFVLSLVMLAVSGAVFVHTATQQSATSTLQVTYDARNVSFSADAWYEKPSNSGTKQAFTGNTLSVSATAGESTTNTLSVTDPITLNANPDTYVLFTYKFVNTASNGGYDMLVSLTDDATKTNVNVKYYTAVTSGTNPTMYNSLSTQVGTVVRTSGITSVPSAICVPAQSSLLYYILVEIDDQTIGATYATGNNNEITWDVSSANTKGAVTPAVTYNANGGVQQNNSTPTREGYTFGGWNTSPDGTGTSFTSAEAASWAGQPITLYAVWETEYTLIISFGTVDGADGWCETFQIWSDYSQASSVAGSVYNAGELVADCRIDFSNGETYFEVKLRTTKPFLCIYGDCQDESEPVLEGLDFATASHGPWHGVGFDIDTTAQVHSIYYSYICWDP